jgi:hypothetical protein
MIKKRIEWQNHGGRIIKDRKMKGVGDFKAAEETASFMAASRGPWGWGNFLSWAGREN